MISSRRAVKVRGRAMDIGRVVSNGKRAGGQKSAAKREWLPFGVVSWLTA
jgi:hypothetical protein